MEAIWIDESIDRLLQESINNISNLYLVGVIKGNFFVSISLEQAEKQYKDWKWDYKFEGKGI